jgi:hypothetical protein
VSSMSERTTLAPWWAKRRAADLPTPWPAPVIIATYGVRRWEGSVGEMNE